MLIAHGWEMFNLYFSLVSFFLPCMCDAHVVNTRQKYDFVVFNLSVFELGFETLLLNT